MKRSNPKANLNSFERSKTKTTTKKKKKEMQVLKGDESNWI